MTYSVHPEPHLIHRGSWLRAAVLGANDGLISTASLVVGVAAANQSNSVLLITGIAAMISGAISMAAGEYISVSSQADIEKADLALEKQELKHNPKQELLELTLIYEQRGLDKALAKQVAQALTEHDALQAHARDEIGITEISQAKPLQAAIASALSFILGAAMPVLAVVLLPHNHFMYTLGAITLFALALLGVISARLGGAPILPAVLRIVIWGVLAMLATSMIGQLFGVSG